jgi:acyl-coenzyme A thioesterase 9
VYGYAISWPSYESSQLNKQIESVQLMFPQDRNLHGKVFGGFLMRLALYVHSFSWLTKLPFFVSPELHQRTAGDALICSELCFTNAAIFASEPMRFLSLDQITFRLPVPIGAVLRLSSKVVKTTKPSADGNEPAKAHILVRAEVEEVETGVSRSQPHHHQPRDIHQAGTAKRSRG